MEILFKSKAFRIFAIFCSAVLWARKPFLKRNLALISLYPSSKEYVSGTVFVPEGATIIVFKVFHR